MGNLELLPFGQGQAETEPEPEERFPGPIRYDIHAGKEESVGIWAIYDEKHRTVLADCFHLQDEPVRINGWEQSAKEVLELILRSYPDAQTLQALLLSETAAKTVLSAGTPDGWTRGFRLDTLTHGRCVEGEKEIDEAEAVIKHFKSSNDSHESVAQMTLSRIQ